MVATHYLNAQMPTSLLVELCSVREECNKGAAPCCIVLRAASPNVRDSCAPSYFGHTNKERPTSTCVTTPDPHISFIEFRPDDLASSRKARLTEDLSKNLDDPATPLALPKNTYC
jgi:hypothetical protein